VTIQAPPGWLQAELGFLVEYWPAGDETALRADGAAWLAAAGRLSGLAGQWQSLADGIARALPGGTEDRDGAGAAFLADAARLGQQLLDEAAQLQRRGELAFDFGSKVEYVKINIIVLGTVVNAMLAWMFGNAVYTLGASLAGVQPLLAWARVAVEALVQAVLRSVLVDAPVGALAGAGLGLFLDSSIQYLQMLTGGRRWQGWDSQATLGAFIGGTVFGLAGGLSQLADVLPVRGALGELATQLPAHFGLGSAAGVTAAELDALTQGGHLTPRELADAALKGGLGMLGPARDITETLDRPGTETPDRPNTARDPSAALSNTGNPGPATAHAEQAHPTVGTETSRRISEPDTGQQRITGSGTAEPAIQAARATVADIRGADPAGSGDRPIATSDTAIPDMTTGRPHEATAGATSAPARPLEAAPSEPGTADTHRSGWIGAAADPALHGVPEQARTTPSHDVGTPAPLAGHAPAHSAHEGPRSEPHTSAQPHPAASLLRETGGLETRGATQVETGAKGAPQSNREPLADAEPRPETSGHDHPASVGRIPDAATHPADTPSSRTAAEITTETRARAAESAIRSREYGPTATPAAAAHEPAPGNTQTHSEPQSPAGVEARSAATADTAPGSLGTRTPDTPTSAHRPEPASASGTTSAAEAGRGVSLQPHLDSTGPGLPPGGGPSVEQRPVSRRSDSDTIAVQSPAHERTALETGRPGPDERIPPATGQRPGTRAGGDGSVGSGYTDTDSARPQTDTGSAQPPPEGQAGTASPRARSHEHLPPAPAGARQTGSDPAEPRHEARGTWDGRGKPGDEHETAARQVIDWLGDPTRQDQPVAVRIDPSKPDELNRSLSKLLNRQADQERHPSGSTADHGDPPAPIQGSALLARDELTGWLSDLAEVRGPILAELDRGTWPQLTGAELKSETGDPPGRPSGKLAGLLADLQREADRVRSAAPEPGEQRYDVYLIDAMHTEDTEDSEYPYDYPDIDWEAEERSWGPPPDDDEPQVDGYGRAGGSAPAA
jgi:hypothetical protein